jgi:hypothetical protein
MPGVEIVGAHVSVAGSYRPPVLTAALDVSIPPNTTIRFPVHVVVCLVRPLGAPIVESADQESELGSYRPPVFVEPRPGTDPPQTSISAPVQTAVWNWRADGTPGPVEVGIQLSVAGRYLPPVDTISVPCPPQMIISVPVHTAVWR